MNFAKLFVAIRERIKGNIFHPASQFTQVISSCLSYTLLSQLSCLQSTSQILVKPQERVKAAHDNRKVSLSSAVCCAVNNSRGSNVTYANMWYYSAIDNTIE